MITGFAIRNFKNLIALPAAEDEFVPFGSLNVLIGPNGCGKSSLLQAIDFLRAFFLSSVEVYLQRQEWDFDDLPNLRQEAKKIAWRVQARLDADDRGVGAGLYDYQVTLQPRRYLSIGEERLLWTAPGKETITLLQRSGRQVAYSTVDAGERKTWQVESVNLPASFLSTIDPASPEGRRFPEALHFREWVEGFTHFLIWDPKVLREPSFRPGLFPHQTPTRLGASGEHLAAVLDSLRQTNPPGFDRLVSRVRSLVPTFSGLEFDSLGRSLSIQQREGDAVYNSRQMSDGVLRLLAVASLLYAERPPSVVMFEEPENGVHPQLIREVVQILRELTQRKPPCRTQVFITTHSPYVLDEFLDHPEQVYAMERSQPGAGATITRVSEPTSTAKVREVFDGSLGEAWFSGLLGATAKG